MQTGVINRNHRTVYWPGRSQFEELTVN
jgi:hypothetical protein